jgi:hypothetical protein
LGPKINLAFLNLKLKRKKLEKISRFLKNKISFFERKGCHHWLALGPKINLAILNPKPKRNKLKKNWRFLKNKNSFLEGRVATTGWGWAQKSVGLF